MFKRVCSFVLIWYLASTNAQTTKDCGLNRGCFLHPKDCVDANCLFIYKWVDNKDSTNFEITGVVEPGDLVWLAIGFGNNRQMGDDCVVMCKHMKDVNTIEHYYNEGPYQPSVFPSNATIGLSNSSITLNNKFLTCKFTRVKKNPNVDHYFDLDQKFFILAAHGPIIGTDIQQHDSGVPQTSAVPIDYTSFEVYSSEVLSKLSIQIHASLAIISWILFASTGIIVARYFKGLYENLKPCKVNVWFFLHRPIMIMVALLSVVSFAFILSYKNWKWIPSLNKKAFIHSLCGIFTLILLWIQPFLALLRCDKDHPSRFLFNGAHFLIGISAFTLSIITIFLGNFLRTFSSNEIIRSILIGWCLWLVLVIIMLEILKYRDSKSNSLSIDKFSLVSTKKISMLAKIVLILHVLITIGTVITLIHFIFKK